MANIFDFKDKDFTNKEKHKSISAKLNFVCPSCGTKNKGLARAYLNKGRYLNIYAQVTIICENKKCKNKITELVSVRLEHR